MVGAWSSHYEERRISRRTLPLSPECTRFVSDQVGWLHQRVNELVRAQFDFAKAIHHMGGMAGGLQLPAEFQESLNKTLASCHLAVGPIGPAPASGSHAQGTPQKGKNGDAAAAASGSGTPGGEEFVRKCHCLYSYSTSKLIPLTLLLHLFHLVKSIMRKIG